MDLTCYIHCLPSITFPTEKAERMLEKATASTATYSVFSPIFLLTRTCCFLPVKIKSVGQSTVIYWSWIYYGVSVNVFACMMAWIVFGLSKSYGIYDVYKIRLYELSGMFITILDDSYLLSTFALATLVTPITFKHFCTYFRCLNKVDCFLKQQVIGEKKKCSAVLFVTLALTVFILGLDMGTWWKHVFSKHINIGLYLLYNLPFYYTYFLVMVIEMNYWYLVQMINVRLADLNHNLMEKYNQYKSYGTKHKLLRTRNSVDNAASVLKDSSKDPFARSISSSIKIYELLFEASRAVNDFYGLNILLVVIGCFIHLLVTPYDLYLELRYKDYTFIFPQICWMISHVLRLLLVVEPCHTAAQGVKRASALVCQFLSLDLSEDLFFQLDILATQLFHCPIQYTAFDLVVLDRSFLTKITGGVTTYLVILFQFEN